MTEAASVFERKTGAGLGLKSKILSEPILVGREQELQELQLLLDSTIKGNGATVFVSGEAGSGKTRLTREFLSSAKQKGVGVMAGWCLSDAAVPFFPFIEAFNAYFASFADEESPINPQHVGIQFGLGGTAQKGPEELEITKWLTGPRPFEKTGKPEPLTPQVWKDQAFDRVAKTLLTISIQGPLVLFLEDIHWADSASLALLHYISRVINNSERILVLATFRSEEVTTDSEGHPHPLEEEMRLMSREDLFVEIRLSNLKQTAVSVIAQNMMGGPIQQELVEKLAKESNGNALFLVESLRMLVERKGLVQENSEWRLAVDDLGIPSKIKDIILRRLAVLKYAQRRVLDAASVIGEKFTVELLASVLDQERLDVLDSLNIIAQSTSIVNDEEAFYKFDHASSREVLYEALSLSLKKGYHARVAERLESLGKDGNMPNADLAYHCVQAGNEEKAIKYSLAAGHEALASYSNIQAISHFQYVRQTIKDNPERLNEKTAALEGLGDAYYAVGSFYDAVKTFEQLADIQQGVVKLRALRKAMFAAYFQGDIQRLKGLTDEAEKNATANRLENARVLHQRARVLGIQGQTEASLELNSEALRVFEEEYALEDEAWSLFVVGYQQCTLLQYEKGLASGLRSVALYDDLKDFRSQMEAYFYLGISFGTCKLDQEGRDSLVKIIEIDNRFKMANYIQLIPAYAFLSMNFQEARDLKEAISKSLQALDLIQKTSSYLYLGLVYENLIKQYVLTNDMALADRYFEKLMSFPQEALSTGFTLGFFGLTKAIYYAGKNRFEESNQYFKDFFEKTNPFENFYWEISHRRAYAWCLDRQGRLEEAKAQLEQAQKISDFGLEKFSHVNVLASLTTFTTPTANQRFNLRLDLVNVARTAGSIVKIENLLVPDLKIVDFPPDCIMKDGLVEFKDKIIKPFEVKTIKLTAKASKLGLFNLTPTITYLDDLGKTKESSTRPFTITIQPVQPKYEVLPGRVHTGSEELDALLFGGIPQNMAAVLSSPSNDEKKLVVEKFLETGAIAGETTFYVAAEVGNVKTLSERHPSNFYLFLCNSQADAMIQNLPNVFKIKGIDSLTDIDISLTKAYRSLDPSRTDPKRICIEIISDVLLQHHAINARRWLSALLPTLKSKGFTVLAIVDPQMHPPEETQSVLGLFDGEISIYEKETEKGAGRFLRIRRLNNQKYLKDEIRLTDE